MRFTLPSLLGLILLMWHQALALPATSTKIAEIERDITNPYNITAVNGVGPSLGTSDSSTWSSTPLRTRLLFDMPRAITNDMGLMKTLLAYKLLLTYTGSTTGGTVYYDIYAQLGLRIADLRICSYGPFTLQSSGKSNGNAWVQITCPLVIAWLDTVTGKLISVFWTTKYQFGQNDPDLSYTDFMNSAPSGWEISGSLPGVGCPQSGVGTAVKPTSWSLLPWSEIIDSSK